MGLGHTWGAQFSFWFYAQDSPLVLLVESYTIPRGALPAMLLPFHAITLVLLVMC